MSPYTLAIPSPILSTFPDSSNAFCCPFAAASFPEIRASRMDVTSDVAGFSVAKVRVFVRCSFFFALELVIALGREEGGYQDAGKEGGAN